MKHNGKQMQQNKHYAKDKTDIYTLLQGTLSLSHTHTFVTCKWANYGTLHSSVVPSYFTDNIVGPS